MTSRAGPREPLQRSFSATNTFSRPSPHRTLSQQFTSSAPTRRVLEASGDVSEQEGVGRHAPRIGTSRLRLEVSTNSKNAVVGSPAQISDVSAAWKPSLPLPLPPRGRPVLHSDVLSVSVNNSSPRTSQDERQGEPIVMLPIPLPTRPGQHAPPPSSSRRQTAVVAPKKDARPKPYNLEVPILAPHYSPNGHADFFPWVGNHAEDQFSDSIIRHGYVDKAQMTQNEGGSAKQSIFPALKHKSGLQTLSSLFTSVLAQRRAHGQITSASTFKPPPRVTVTDTKREMWLKDLANPTISLRRLSRSIPHGIRGKVLLEQSLSKNIPIERAVWLAKCVGANELRSFRRKGVSGTFAMGGEAKWIRDFTVCVEQFLESISGTCGDKDFRVRIDYAIRLATYFHAEHLLDRDHYMDWLVTSLENSPQARLPMWLVITEIYWKDILQYRKYGRRLATALMSQLAESTSHPDQDILAPLCARLVQLVKSLMISNPESFIAPKTWLKYREVVLSSLSSGHADPPPIFASIDRRNSRIALPKAEKELNLQRRFIRLLDATLSRPFDQEMSRQWWQLDNDKDELVRTILDWATSYHRFGHTKIYVAARVLRAWTTLGIDVTAAVLTFISSNVCGSVRNKTALYHLVSELARSGHFSTPRYLQWLIARGGLQEASDVGVDAPLATRLLAELPLHSLSESILDLRMTLLTRAGFSVDDEEEQTKKCMAFITADLPDMQTHAESNLDGVTIPETEARISTVVSGSRTIKSELGLWLRQKARAQMTQPTIPPLDDWDDSPTKRGTSAINASEFDSIRRHFELLDDYSMLADTMMFVVRSNDADVLASCTDTLNLHLETFAAIGALTGLFDVLITRMRALCEEVDTVPRALLVSAADLAGRIPGQETTARLLSQELFRSDRKTAADACSPVSDHMAVVETAESDMIDEIERSLASGNTMDHDTLDRMFQRIILLLEASWTKTPEQQRTCGLLLTRLGTFDSKHCDVLMNAWVSRLLRQQGRPNLASILAPLIAFGCLLLRNVMVAFNNLATSIDDPSMALDIIALLIGSFHVQGIMTRQELYRLRIRRAQMQSDHPEDALLVIRNALRSFSSIRASNKDLPDQIQTVFNTPSMLQLLQRLALRSIEEFTQYLILPVIENGSPISGKIIHNFIDGLLVATGSPNPINIDMLLSSASELSLPFCQIKLASMLRGDDNKDGDVARSDHLDAFDAAIKAAVSNGNTSWASIIPMLDNSVASHLRHRAEQQFLALFPSPKSIQPSASVNTIENVKRAHDILRIINTTVCSSAAVTTYPSLGPDIVAACNGLWGLMSNPPSPAIKLRIVVDWLPLLLSFIAIRASAFDASKSGHENRAKTILSLIAMHLHLRVLEMETQVASGLVEQTFDLALHLVDDLPDDIRLQCIRSLRDTSYIPSVAYILSFFSNPSEWLVLMQKDRLSFASGPEVRSSDKGRPAAFPLRRWEMLGEPTPNVGENDTSLSLTLFGARRN